MVQVSDWVYSPFRDSIFLIFWVPEMLTYVQCEISRYEDLPKKIEGLKKEILSGKYFTT